MVIGTRTLELELESQRACCLLELVLLLLNPCPCPLLVLSLSLSLCCMFGFSVDFGSKQVQEIVLSADVRCSQCQKRVADIMSRMGGKISL